MDYLGVDFSTIHMNSRPKYEREFLTSILVFHINWILQYGNANAMQGSFKLATPTLGTCLKCARMLLHRDATETRPTDTLSALICQHMYTLNH